MKRNRFINKLKSKSGMTLLELLAATLILLLVSEVMASGVQLAQRQYLQSIRKSEAEELYSTLETVITNELRYTEKVTVKTDAAGNNVVCFRSTKYPAGNNGTIQILNDAGTICADPSTSYGEVAIGSATKNYRVLESDAYANGLAVCLKSFTFDDTTNVFNVQLSVKANDKEYAQGTFQVKGLALEK